MTRHDAERAPVTAEALASGCRDAAQRIAAALAQPAAERARSIVGVIPLVARLRDGLIAPRRAGSLVPELDTALVDLNAALSLLVAIGYPEGRTPDDYPEQARDLLRAIAERAESARR